MRYFLLLCLGFQLFSVFAFGADNWAPIRVHEVARCGNLFGLLAKKFDVVWDGENPAARQTLVRPKPPVNPRTLADWALSLVGGASKKAEPKIETRFEELTHQYKGYFVTVQVFNRAPRAEPSAFKVKSVSGDVLSLHPVAEPIQGTLLDRWQDGEVLVLKLSDRVVRVPLKENEVVLIHTKSGGSWFDDIGGGGGDFDPSNAMYQ